MKFAALLSLLLVSSHAFQVPTQVRTTATSLAATSEDDARRIFLGSSMAAAASLMLPTMPAHAADGGVDYKAVAADIMDLVKKNPDWGPSKFTYFLSWTGLLSLSASLINSLVFLFSFRPTCLAFFGNL